MSAEQSTPRRPSSSGRPSSSSKPRRPALFGPAVVDTFTGAPDPAQRIEAAHTTAEALIRHGRASGDAETARLVALADEHGIDELAELWADCPPDTLPGVLWRLYALRAAIRHDPVEFARAFDTGRRQAQVHEVVAGVGDPPGPQEVCALADVVLAGAFIGDFPVTLERAGAFCRVISAGWALLADDDAPSTGLPLYGPPLHGLTRTLGRSDPGARLTRHALNLLQTGAQLEAAAARSRAGTLN